MTEPDPLDVLARAIQKDPQRVALVLYRSLYDLEQERERFRVALKQLGFEWISAEFEGRARSGMQCAEELQKLIKERL